MGKHVHEHVELQIDSDQIAGADEESSDEEKLKALIESLADEDVEVHVETTTTEVDPDPCDNC